MIEATKLSKQELEECCKIMRKGNKRLKALAAIAGMEHKGFRARLFKKQFDAIEWPELNAAQVVVFMEAIPDIQAVRNIEWKVFCAFYRLAKQMVKKMGSIVVDKDDFLQEASMALLDAIYGYSEEETQFITYAWWCVHHRLSKAINSNNPFSPLTNEAIKLLKRYEEVKVSLNRYATSDEICNVANFTAEERLLVLDVQVKVHNQAQMVEKEDQNVNDYTNYRRGINREKDTVTCNFEIREAMERAKLTELERLVVETSLRSTSHGWRAELAKTTFNPTTQKPYTRAGIAIILEKALAKIKKAYLRRKVA